MTDSKLEANGRQLGEMSIIDHLEALRWTLVRVFTALGVFIIGGFAFVPWIFKHVVMAPIDNDFFLYRWLAKASSMFKMVPDDLTRPFHVDIINMRSGNLCAPHFTLTSVGTCVSPSSSAR